MFGEFESAVDGEDLAGEPGGGGVGEVEDPGGDFVGFAAAAERDACGFVLFDLVDRAAAGWLLEDGRRSLGRSPRDDELEPQTLAYWEQARAITATDYLPPPSAARQRRSASLSAATTIRCVAPSGPAST